MSNLKFQPGDRVRVVSAASHFCGQTGEVIECHDGDLMRGEKLYRVKLDGSLFSALFLFRETELAFSE